MIIKPPGNIANSIADYATVHHLHGVYRSINFQIRPICSVYAQLSSRAVSEISETMLVSGILPPFAAKPTHALQAAPGLAWHVRVQG